MKLFKGDLSLWKQLTNERLISGPGGLMDGNTYKETVGALVLTVFAFFFFWNLDAMQSNFSEWLNHPETWIHEVSGQALSPNARWHHAIARGFLRFGIFATCISFYSVWTARRRARKSSEGQWYDKAHLTRQDLYKEPHGHSDSSSEGGLDLPAGEHTSAEPSIPDHCTICGGRSEAETIRKYSLADRLGLTVVLTFILTLFSLFVLPDTQANDGAFSYLQGGYLFFAIACGVAVFVLSRMWGAKQQIWRCEKCGKIIEK